MQVSDFFPFSQNSQNAKSFLVKIQEENKKKKKKPIKCFDKDAKHLLQLVLRIRIRWIRMFLDLLDPDSDPLVRGMDRRIRIWIHTKMSWLRNTGCNDKENKKSIKISINDPMHTNCKKGDRPRCRRRPESWDSSLVLYTA